MASKLDAKDLVVGVDGLASGFANLNKQLEELATLLKSTQQSFDKQAKTQSDVAAKTQAVQTTNEKLQAIEKKRIAAINQLNQLNSTAIDRVEDLNVAKQRQNKLNKEEAKLRSNLIGAYEKESIKLNRLRKQYKDLVVAEKENTEAGRKLKANIDKLDASLKKADASVGQFQRNVGNYPTLLSNVSSGFGALTGKIQALIAVSKAFIATPLGLILTAIGVALAPLVSYFKNTQRGADQLKSVFAALGATIDVLKDRLSQIGEGLLFLLQGKFKQGIETITASFKGMGDEIKLESSAARQLEKDLQKLQDREIEFISERDKIKEQIEELRLASKDANKTDEERLILLQKAAKLQQELSDKEVGFSKERARISQEQLDLGESTRDQIRENAELQSEATRIETESKRKQRTIQSEIFSIQRKINKQVEANIQALKDEQKALSDSVYDGIDISEDDIDDRDLLTEKNEIELNNLLSQGDAKYDIIKEQLARELDLFMQTEEAKKTIAQEATNASAQILSDQFNAFVDNNLNKFQEGQEKQEGYLKDRLDKGLISEQQYETKLKQLRLKTRQEEAKAEKKKAMFDIVVSTAAAIINQLRTTPLPLGAPFAINIGALGAAQLSTVAAKPIPKFRMGGKHKEGAAEFSEEGPELFIDTKGNAILTPEKRTIGWMPEGQFFSHNSPETQASLNGGMTPEQYEGLINEQRLTRKAIKNQKQTGYDPRTGNLQTKLNNQRTTYVNKFMRGEEV